MLFGILALITGVTVTVLAVSLGSVAVFFAGFGVVHGGGLIDTTRYYGAAVIALAALALIGLLKSRPRRAAAPAPAATPVSDIR